MRFKSLNTFPWKIFVFYSGFVFLAVGAFSLLFWSFLLWNTELVFLQTYQIFLEFIFCLLIISIFIGYQFSLPVRRIRFKTLQLSLKKTEKDVDPYEVSPDIIHEEKGEFAEIESALYRIHRKTKKRKDQLQKEREENESIMSSVQEGLVSFDLSGKVLYFNSQFATQFISSIQMKDQIYFTDVFRVPELIESFDEVRASGMSRKISIKLQIKLNQTDRFFGISLTPLRRAKNKEVYGVIGVFHDITDIKKAEQIRIDFVSNASHELRTPLTTIKGYVDTLKMDLAEKNYNEVEKFSDTISRNVNRLIELVSDLLSLSTLESQPELHVTHMRALDVTENVVSEMLGLASEKSQMIQVSGHVPDFYADQSKVEQVLRNLISNAIKYVQPHGHIQIAWEMDPDKNIILRVVDDGPGIPEEHHERLFERFYRIDKGRNRDVGGTGLGLAIVKHIMQSHGGRVYVKSQLLKGSEFICVFPSQRVTKRFL